MLDTHQIYNRAAPQWSRDQPVLLSDYTARPFLIEWSKPFLQGHLLDLGCGEGYVARTLAQLGCKHIDSVDVSIEMIRHARLRETAHPQGIRYIVGDACDLSFLGTARYDLVLAVFLFNYLDHSDMTQVFTEIHHRLNPGGALIMSIPHPVMPFLEMPEDRFGFVPSGGYFSGRDQTFEGKIARRDGIEVPVRCVHKTLQDLLKGLSEAGFQSMPDIAELGVTEEHLRLDPEFFSPLTDKPLHLAVKVHKS